MSLELYHASPSIKLRVRIYGLSEQPNLRRIGALSSISKPIFSQQSWPVQELPPPPLYNGFLRKPPSHAKLAIDEPGILYSHQFLTIISVNSPLYKAKAQIHQQFCKLYPEESQIRILRLRDEQDCDLDEDFLVGQLFVNEATVIAICETINSRSSLGNDPLIITNITGTSFTPLSHTDEQIGKSFQDSFPPPTNTPRVEPEPIVDLLPTMAITKTFEEGTAKKVPKSTKIVKPKATSAKQPQTNVKLPPPPTTKASSIPPPPPPSTNPTRLEKVQPHDDDAVPQKAPTKRKVQPEESMMIHNKPSKSKKPNPSNGLEESLMGDQKVMIPTTTSINIKPTDYPKVVSQQPMQAAAAATLTVVPEPVIIPESPPVTPGKVTAGSATSQMLHSVEMHSPRPIHVPPFLSFSKDPAQLATVIQAEPDEDSEESSDEDSSIPTVRSDSITSLILQKNNNTLIEVKAKKQQKSDSTSSDESDFELGDSALTPQPHTSLTALTEELKKANTAAPSMPQSICSKAFLTLQSERGGRGQQDRPRGRKAFPLKPNT